MFCIFLPICHNRSQIRPTLSPVLYLFTVFLYFCLYIFSYLNIIKYNFHIFILKELAEHLWQAIASDEGTQSSVNWFSLQVPLTQCLCNIFTCAQVTHWSGLGIFPHEKQPKKQLTFCYTDTVGFFFSAYQPFPNFTPHPFTWKCLQSDSTSSIQLQSYKV